MRGFAGAPRASGYGRIKDYAKGCADELYLLLQVETPEGLRNVEAIASVEGVDGVFIGPGDLSAAMGHIGNPKHPKVVSVIEDAFKHSMLSTWLSFDDLERAIAAGLSAPMVGHTIVCGVSDNQSCWWNNRHARHIGYRPKDSSDVFRDHIEAQQPVLDKSDPAVIYQGGAIVEVTPHG